MFCLIATGGELTPAAISLSMLVVFASAKLLAEVFERLGQPGIVGEIIAGILIGPQVLGWISPNAITILLADLGVMFLLFRVGLEVKSSELLNVGGTALVVAMAGVALPFVMGWAIAAAWGAPRLESIFIGAAMVATSVGITAQVLAAKGLLQERASRIILAAAVIDDVLGLLVLALVSGMARNSVHVLDLALTAALALGFTLFVAKWGTRTVKRVLPRVERRMNLMREPIRPRHDAAVRAGAAGGLRRRGRHRRRFPGRHGAFRVRGPPRTRPHQRRHRTPGAVLPRRHRPALQRQRLHQRIHHHPGAGHPRARRCYRSLPGCGLGAAALGRKEAIRVGAGMVPRGEVGMVVAQIGLGMGVMQESIYGIVVFMSVATTVIAPPLLKWAFRDVVPAGAQQEIVRLG